MKRRILAAVASVLLAFVAVLGLGARPALAATTYTAIGGSTTIIKNLVVESDANIPDIVFGYTITRGTPVAATSSTIEIMASEVTATIGNATYSNADTASAASGLPTDSGGTTTVGSKYAQKSVSISFPNNSFTKPGVYRYVINETNGGKPGVTYDTSPRYLDVFVVADPNTNALSVSTYVLRATATTIGTDGKYTEEPDAKSSAFTNTINQSNFSFSKAIGGNQGDKTQRFTFTLNITNAIPGVYPINATDVSSNPTSITVASDGTATATYDLTHESSLKVVGLNSGAVCTVSEDNQDYTASHALDTADSVAGSTSGSITIDADHSVAFTNTRNGIIPTGVILTVAPFAIGLMLFGALTVLFVSKSLRRSV